jgi:hypothetical protein
MLSSGLDYFYFSNPLISYSSVVLRPFLGIFAPQRIYHHSILLHPHILVSRNGLANYFELHPILCPNPGLIVSSGLFP